MIGHGPKMKSEKLPKKKKRLIDEWPERSRSFGAPPQIITDHAQQTKRQKKLKITLPDVRGIA